MRDRAPSAPRRGRALRRAAAAVAALGALAAAACAPDRAPTVPGAAAAPPSFAGDPFTGDPNEVTSLVQYLFVEDERDALVEARQVVGNPPSSTAACAGTAALLDRTFADYRGLRLYGQVDQNGPDLTFPRPVVQQLVRRLSLNCPRLASPNGVPDAVLDVGGSAGVIRAADGGTLETIPGPSGQAGVRIQPGTFDEDVVLYIVPRAPTAPLPTTLAQSAPYYDIFVVPAQPSPYRFAVDVGFVVNWPNGAPSDHLVIGHEVTPGAFEILAPTVLVTPSAGAGQWGGPAYLRPAGVAAARTAPTGGASAAAVGAAARSATISYGGQAGSLSPFGLVSIFRSGVNPNQGVTFGASVCTDDSRVIPYTVTTQSDLVISYQEISASGAAVTPRQTLLLRGRAAGGPAGGQVEASNPETTRVRFFYGATAFKTVDANVAGCFR